MKVLDVHGFHSGLNEIQKQLQNLAEQNQELQAAVNGIISLEDSLKGMAGQSIRTYYQEVHQNFLLFFQTFLEDYDKIIEKIKQSLQELEPAENGFIHEAFLDFNLQQGLKKIETITVQLTGEANCIMQAVQDIVSLPRLDNERALYEINRPKQKVKPTIQDLHHFDRQSTSS